jgi:hypothetical protein
MQTVRCLTTVCYIQTYFRTEEQLTHAKCLQFSASIKGAHHQYTIGDIEYGNITIISPFAIISAYWLRLYDFCNICTAAFGTI